MRLELRLKLRLTGCILNTQYVIHLNISPRDLQIRKVINFADIARHWKPFRLIFSLDFVNAGRLNKKTTRDVFASRQKKSREKKTEKNSDCWELDSILFTFFYIVSKSDSFAFWLDKLPLRNSFLNSS